MNQPESVSALQGRHPSAADPDPLLLALARYVQAVHERYPEGPGQLRQSGLDARANMPSVLEPEDPAA